MKKLYNIIVNFARHILKTGLSVLFASLYFIEAVNCMTCSRSEVRYSGEMDKNEVLSANKVIIQFEDSMVHNKKILA